MIINMVGGGGGAALNFKVVPGLTQPGTASENTIWVKTERIGVWYFSATQPEGMQEWDVWFQTGTESVVEFNALRKNAVQVYPLSAKQYVSGELVEVDAMSYHGGEWVTWVKYLYKSGDGFSVGYTKYNESNGRIAITDDSISLTYSSSSGSTVVLLTDIIDVTPYSRIVVKTTATHKTGWPLAMGITKKYATASDMMGISVNTTSDFFDSFVIPETTSGEREWEVNVAAFSGEYRFGWYGVTNGTVVTEIRQEA